MFIIGHFFTLRREPIAIPRTIVNNENMVSQSHMLNHRDLPIGVFDSGIGGLTVLRALEEALPNEHFLYLGDTARLPYGTKTPATILAYAQQNIAHLLQSDVKMVVIACNTASAVALSQLQKAFCSLPIVGVIKPGAIAACQTSSSHHIAVVATECTIQQQAYQRAIHHINEAATVTAISCSLFVQLAEEGWVDDDITTAICHRYLDPLFKNDPSIDCLLLGCTHFPVLIPALKQVLPQHIRIVDSAHTTAKTVMEQLKQENTLSDNNHHKQTQFLVTDGPERFRRLAEIFLGHNINSDQICLI
jgi:glutamate racemase